MKEKSIICKIYIGMLTYSSNINTDFLYGPITSDVFKHVKERVRPEKLGTTESPCNSLWLHGYICDGGDHYYYTLTNVYIYAA